MEEDRKKKFYDAMSVVADEYEKSFGEGIRHARDEESTKIDPRYIGVPNINFSLNYDSTREDEYAKQRIERGFDNSETWSLNTTIASFVWPRLKRFKEVANGFPNCFGSMDEWYDVLDKMISAFEKYASYDDVTMDMEMDEINKLEAEIQEGIDLFAKYFFKLWW